MSSQTNLYIDNHWPTSKAFLALKTAAAIQVLLIFCKKRRFARVGRAGKKQYEMINNGELVFTYADAKRKYGFTESRFNRAIDELVEKGFLDIAQTGAGLFKKTTFYSLGSRWLKYGTREFKEVVRPKSRHYRFGFSRGNILGKRRKRKIFLPVTDDHSAMRTDAHSRILAMRTNAHGQTIKTLYKCSNGQWLGRQIA